MTDVPMDDVLTELGESLKTNLQQQVVHTKDWLQDPNDPTLSLQLQQLKQNEDNLRAKIINAQSRGGMTTASALETISESNQRATQLVAEQQQVEKDLMKAAQVISLLEFVVGVVV